MKALNQSRASIVGKGAHLLYLEGTNLLIMRNPNQQNKFVRFISGATILFNKLVFKRVRFPDTSLGEDVNFLHKSLMSGYKIFASSPHNFVAIRRKNKKSHTWTAKDQDLLKGSRIVAKTARFRMIATRYK